MRFGPIVDRTQAFEAGARASNRRAVHSLALAATLARCAAGVGATNRDGVRFLIALKAYPKRRAGDVRLLVKATQLLQGDLRVARAFEPVKHVRLKVTHALESACHSRPTVSYF
jgi:hypothetical protein